MHIIERRAEAGIVDALAQSIYAQDRPEPLLALCKEAAEQTGTTRAFLHLGKYLWLSGDVDAAKVAFRKAVILGKPDNAEPYVRLADFYESIGDQQSALTELRRAYGISPHDRQLADRLRAHGMVPGPTIALPPEKLLEDEYE